MSTQFFINWKNPIPLSLIIIAGSLNDYENYFDMKVIEKYKKLGIIKNFKVL